jgi:hypothetical protein
VFVTNAVTFTATVSSSAATPTGSISFFDGLTLLVSVPLAQGMATYTTSGLAIGTHTITASYSGDTNFAALTSSAVAQLVIDFSVGASTPVGQPYPPIVLPGASTSYTILATPTRGANFPSPVTFSISGLPAGATAVFTPTTVPAGSAATNVTLSVQLAHQILAHHPVKPLGGGLALAMMGGMLLLPFARKLAASGGPARRVACLLLLVLAVAGAALGLTGCAAPRSGYFGQKEVNYTMTVTATSGALSHTTTVALTVE